MRLSRCVLIALAVIALAPRWTFADGRLTNDDFAIAFGPQGITSLKRIGDAYDTEYVAPGEVLGNIAIRYRMPGQDWRLIRESALAHEPNGEDGRLVYSFLAASSDSSPLQAEESFALDGGSLLWTLTLTNLGGEPLEIGDLAVPLAMAEGTPQRRGRIYTQKLIRHSFIAGHGSWVYWQRANAEGPFLVMVPQGRAKFEFTGSVMGDEPRRGPGGRRNRGPFTPFIHAAVSSADPVARGKAAGRDKPWRLPISSHMLGIKDSPENSVTYSFRFAWAKDFDDVREVLVNAGSFDVNIVPGMTLPTDLSALVAIRSRQTIKAVEAEFPDQTTVEFVTERSPGTRVYKVRFSRLGENQLTVHYGDGLTSTLPFFVTEPLETVIAKRAHFLTSRMQHRNSDQWWYGAYSDWDQVGKVLRSPVDRDGLPHWLTDANDDAGNARPAFVASKNVFFPVQREIDSVELYISRYLFNGAKWNQGVGGMQMTEAEPYPYGLYGAFENWQQHRTIDPVPPTNFRPQNPRLSQEVGWKRLHREHLWRIYDYPHIMLMYFRMYQIAKVHPTMVHFANADEYLMLAYNTSVAYWTVPMQTDRPNGWSANSVPTMNEAFVPELIAALKREGKVAESARLHDLWNSKVTRFVNAETRPNLFGSEFAFDSTGFESTGAMAHYAMDCAQKPDANVGYTLEQARAFLEFQLRLNLGDRGWLETTYYQLGSDYRGSLNYLLSYMSQMGGWSILDYGLHFADDPDQHLRLGYASILSSWALVNSGSEESGYGYWWPGKENDGAAGGGFSPEPMGGGWIGKAVPRGAWAYSAEVDVGYCGALRAHATIVADDPLFGEFAYGGELTRRGNAIEVTPRDGLRTRVHVVRNDQRLHLELHGAGFAKDRPVIVDDPLERIEFTLENRVEEAHRGELEIRGLPGDDYEIVVDGVAEALSVQDHAASPTVSLPAGIGATTLITIRWTAPRGI